MAQRIQKISTNNNFKLLYKSINLILFIQKPAIV
jgi:hypothetical protein